MGVLNMKKLEKTKWVVWRKSWLEELLDTLQKKRVMEKKKW
jgi:hypothetical protein